MKPSKHPSNGWIGPALLVLLALILIPLGLRAGVNRGADITATPLIAAPADPTITQGVSEPSPTQAAALQESTPPAAATGQPVESQPATAAGLWVYYGETTAPNQTTIWKTQAEQAATIDGRQAVAAIDHQEGYPPRGSVSPDGSWLALQVVPPGTSERAARSDGTEIWLVNLDQPLPVEPQRILTQAGFLAQWAPDSRSLVFGRRVSLDNPPDPLVPFRTEMAAYDITQNTTSMLYSDETAYSTQPLGWAGSTGRFYVSEVDLSGQWSVVLKDPQDATFEQRTLLSPGNTYRSISLAPGGGELLLEKVNEDQVSLTLFSLETGQETQVVLGKKTDQPYGPFTALWAADSRSLFIHRLETTNKPAAMERFELASQALTPMALPAPEGNSFIPLSLSPDLAWIVLRDYTAADLPLVLQRVPGADSLSLPRQQTGNGLTFFGWQVR